MNNHQTQECTMEVVEGGQESPFSTSVPQKMPSTPKSVENVPSTLGIKSKRVHQLQEHFNLFFLLKLLY